ncbi:MAG: response regulator [Verrucomicrobiota bacterium]
MARQDVKLIGHDEFTQITKVGTFTLAWESEKKRFIFRNVNDSFSDLLSVPSKYIVGRDILSALPITFAADFEGCCLESHTQAKETVHRLCYRFDSGEIWLLFHLTPANESQSFPGLLGICLDVTHIMRAQNTLSQTDELAAYVSTALNRFSNPILIAQRMSDEFCVIHINQAFTAQLGYVSGEVVGRDPFFLLFRKGLVFFQSQMTHLDDEGVSFSQRAICYSQAGNKAIWRVVFEPIREKDLRMSGIRIRLYATDQDEGESAVEEILSPEDHSKEERIALSDVAYGISSDFKQLVSMIENHLELLKPIPEKTALCCLEFCRKAVESASESLVDLLKSVPQELEVHSSTVQIGTQTRNISLDIENQTAKEDLYALIVVTERMIQLMIDDALAGKGFRTKIASSGKNAIESLKESDEFPHVIVVDYQLVDMTGLNFVREVRQHNFEQQFVMVTSYMRDEKALELRKEKLITLFKPFAAKQLLKAVHKALQNSAQKE